ncbi:MAG: hypothetical protein V1702_04020 [Candidatus Woesearchaeota archaeon]
MYSFEVRDHLGKTFEKIGKKNRKQLEIIHNKIAEVLQNPQHYKNLRSPLQHLKSVHIDKSFVLLFSVDENLKKIIFEELDHHDRIYK